MFDRELICSELICVVCVCVCECLQSKLPSLSFVIGELLLAGMLGTAIETLEQCSRRHDVTSVTLE